MLSATSQNKPRLPFQSSLWSSVIAGGLLASAFYALQISGWLRHDLLQRYTLSHFVAVLSVYMFLIALASIAQKLIVAQTQLRLAKRASLALQGLTQHVPPGKPIESANWLQLIWKSQSTPIFRSWMGSRILEIVSKQIKRGSCRLLDEDLQEQATRDADYQHESYGLIRIMTWAMPMLGFLGTVIGISATLGQMDTKSLASGSQEAMDGLTAGLYVAFDTTAVGLVLTMTTMFAMFGASRIEVRLLNFIDTETSDALQSMLSDKQADEHPNDRIEMVVSSLTVELLKSMESIVERQSILWRESMLEAQSQWAELASTARSTVETSLTQSLDASLDRYVKAFDRSQQDGIAQIEARYQQWQTTLSEQTRSMHSHHSQLVRQTELLENLVANNQAFQAIENSLQNTLTRLTDIDRFHEAAVCLTEAVAVLGTQMERSGFLGRKAIRRVPNPPERRAA